MSILYFLILIAVLVFVHEFGHFIVAKAFDVKVLRFSIGFGPALLSFQKGETEYVICALPLGGYVQMLGADLESVEELEDEDKDRALMQKPIWQRSLIVLAGPAFNILLPIVIFILVGLGQTSVPPAVVGEVFPDTPAQQAGLSPGDKIVEVDGKKIDYWHQLTNIIATSYDREIPIVYERDGQRHTTNATPELRTSTDFLGLNRRTYGALGIYLGTYGTTVAVTNADSAAAQAGLMTTDKIAAINGQPIKRFDEIDSFLRANHGSTVELTIYKRLAMATDFGQFYAQKPTTISLSVPANDNVSLEQLGIAPIEMHILSVTENSAADSAGLIPGDRIVGLEGKRYSNWTVLQQRINNIINEHILNAHNNNDEPISIKPELTLSYVRSGVEYSTILSPTIVGYLDDTKQQQYKIDIGWEHLRDNVMPDDIAFPFFARLSHATVDSLTQTVGFVKIMYVGLMRMAQGRVSKESIGGPIMIGELAAEAGRAGLEPFLQMMALISINLAIINLLPIPVLDGGHLLLFALEAIKRGPLSFRTRQIAAYIGFSFIVFLMIFAFKNDIERNWYRVAEYFDESP